MDFRRPLTPDPTAFLPAADAVAKFAAALLVMLVGFLSRDPVTPAILLAGVALGLAGSGLRPADLGRTVAPLLVAAAVLGLLNVLLAGTPAGAEPGTVADRAAVGLAVGLRIAVIALAGMVAVATTEPADLANGLIVHLGVPPRLAIGALATLRLVPVLGAEWRTIGLARRARGVDAGRNPLVAARLAVVALVIILVSTIRRATRLALAMDARGFDSHRPRSVARPPRMRRGDWLLVAAAVVLGGSAILVSAALGSWRFLFG